MKKLNIAKISNLKKIRQKISQNKWIIFFIISLIIILADQAAKYFITKSMIKSGIAQAAVIDNFFYIVFTKNFGASFGMLQHKTILLMSISAAIIILIIALLKITPRILAPFSALMAGGALSNLIDRAVHGFVIDYFNFPFWPSFNIADIAITIGAFGIALYLIRELSRTTANRPVA